ncbi:MULTISPECIES: NAD(P)/FAD-dependent oxidoreductase [Streptosporangium]|uniref:Thioredoxin reductase (NADPH) n=1 Tax=Streptosporangium brasiliense TaxID=47480 RepID=A0ABT9R808_9ACTN|nr:NAD(P)/FAD-dependent oxidoreductase [Streptosporangium brasiliense]MDP9865374.1 thioredoxin reductase (NADPH) [Streptosporangium brasiliense]
MLWDTIVIGGGAAGLSAGVVLSRARFATLVVDGGEPRNGPADHMHGYLTRDGMAPGEFVATGREELARYGGTLVRASVTGARRAPDGTFELRLDDNRALRARSVLVATGLTDELPDIPGLSERWASEVHHCPHCHGYEVRGRTIAVIGGAMAAVSAHLAALMRRHSSSVTFCVNGAEVSTAQRQRLTAYGVRLIDARVTRVVANAGTAGGDPVAIELDNGGTVACEAIFVAPRPVPHEAVLTALGAGKDPVSGLVAVDPQGATDVPGVWAAGNVVNPRAQVIAAAGAGSTAAINMTGWLLERELSAALSPDGPDAGGAI